MAPGLDRQLSTVVPRVDRVEADMAELGQIGRRPTGGMQRLAWTEEEFAAKTFLTGRLEALGLAPELDEAANVWADLGQGEGPALVIGSHLDTVPEGGRYDGALGVMAALEVVRLLVESGRPLRRRVRLCAFTDEEGARFGTGLFGSTALAGDADMDHLAAVTDRQGVSLSEAMAARGKHLERLPDAPRRLVDAAAYLELHIEQGPRLERMGRDVGLVTTITGIHQVRYRFLGEANHAGTTAIGDRRDALLPAAQTALAVRRAVEGADGRAVATVGYLDALPGAANVVPGEARMAVEVRSPDSALMDEIHREIAAEAREAAGGRVEVRIDEGHLAHPADMDRLWRERLRAQATAIGEEAVDLVSWAGHDAGALARVLPAAMVFVPSHDGVSHAPTEFTAPERYRAGLTVFARTVCQWAWGLGA